MQPGPMPTLLPGSGRRDACPYAWASSQRADAPRQPDDTARELFKAIHRFRIGTFAETLVQNKRHPGIGQDNGLDEGQGVEFGC